MKLIYSFIFILVAMSHNHAQSYFDGKNYSKKYQSFAKVIDEKVNESLNQKPEKYNPFLSTYEVDFGKKQIPTEFINIYLKSKSLRLWRGEERYNGKYDYYYLFTFVKISEYQVYEAGKNIKTVEQLTSFINEYPKEKDYILDDYIYRRILHHSDSVIYTTADLLDHFNFDNITIRNIDLTLSHYFYSHRKDTLSLFTELRYFRNLSYLHFEQFNELRNSVFLHLTNNYDINQLYTFLQLYPNSTNSTEIKEFIRFSKTTLGQKLMPTSDGLTGTYELKTLSRKAIENQWPRYEFIQVHVSESGKLIRLFNKNLSEHPDAILMSPTVGGKLQFANPERMSLTEYYLEFNSPKINLHFGLIFTGLLGSYEKIAPILTVDTFYNVSRLKVVGEDIYHITDPNGCLVAGDAPALFTWNGKCDNDNFATGEGLLKSIRFKNITENGYADYKGSMKKGKVDGSGCYLKIYDGCGTWKEGKRVD